MPGTRCLGRAVGSTVDPKIACLNKRLLRLSQGGSLVPEGTESVPKDDMPGDCVTLIRRLTAVRTVVCSPKRARWFAVGQPRTGSLSPGREAELGPGGLARAEDRSRPRPMLEATSATTDQVALEALGLLQLAGYPKIPRAETASRLDNLGALPFEWADPEVWPLYSRGHTQATRSVCVFDAPEGAPHRIAPMASGLISLHSPSQARLSRPTNGAPASEEAGFYPCRRSGSPPKGG
jgi:hypothetical protein